MDDIVLASRNRKKLQELSELLAPLGRRARLVSEFSDEDVAETAPTFIENALLKARHAAKASGLPTIADDSGLEVDALQGAPGVRSARFAGELADDAANNRKLLAALEGLPESARTARFVCVLVLLRHPDDPRPLIAQGEWHGRILDQAQGKSGFGYDPLFFVPEQNCSAAQLPAELKNRLSHRARAMAQMRVELRRNLSA